jgi:energy-converting hydrogenase Eha subunit A
MTQSGGVHSSAGEDLQEIAASLDLPVIYPDRGRRTTWELRSIAPGARVAFDEKDV